jgi:hypothetical protein
LKKGVLKMTKQQIRTNGNGDGLKEAIVGESLIAEQKDVSDAASLEASTESVHDVQAEVHGSEKELPSAVTEAPQEEEHMDLRKVKPYKEWLRAYLNVSDDKGGFLGDEDLENEVTTLCVKLNSMDIDKDQNLNALVATVKDTLMRYASKVNVTENISAGVITKYRIRQGLLLRHLKKLVTKGLKMIWTEWFKENCDPGLLRSAQDYMRIAAVPNAIRYSVFGKERLIAIIRQLQDPKGDDPIGDFLSENGIEFNTDVESDSEEIRLKADIAINQRKLVSEELGEIPLDKVKTFVETGNMITPKHIRELKLVKQTGGDLSSYMDDLIASNGKADPVMTPDRKAANYKSAFVSFLHKTKEAISDQEYIGEIELDLWKELKDKVEELESLISSKLSN